MDEQHAPVGTPAPPARRDPDAVLPRPRPYDTGPYSYSPAPYGPYGTMPPGHPSFPPMPVPADVHRPPYPAPSGAPRTAVVLALTVVALAVLTLAGILLYPRLTAATVVAAPTVAAPVPTVAAPVAPAVPRSASGYSCGTSNGYSIWVNNGNVPCTSAQWVTSMWTTSGQTPRSGTGPAGTPYSWTCSSTSGAVGLCTSKMGSTFTISS